MIYIETRSRRFLDVSLRDTHVLNALGRLKLMKYEGDAYEVSFISIIQHKDTVNSLDRKWSDCALATHSCYSLSCLQAADPRCAFVLSSYLQLASYDSSLFLLTLTYL